MGLRGFLREKATRAAHHMLHGGEAQAAGALSELPDPGIGFKWVSIPEMSDKFAGPADRNKWEFFNKGWKGRPPGLFMEKNVTVSDGALRLTSHAENPPPGSPPQYKGFTTAFVRSKHLQKYGYFEIACKAMDAVTSSSFWFAKNEGPDGWWTEIDVFEYGNSGWHANRFATNAHVFHDPGSKVSRVALDWSEDRINWMLNGKLMRTLPNTYWHRPMALQFDSETMEGYLGLPSKDDPRFPATFEIYYVRSFKRVPVYRR